MTTKDGALALAFVLLLSACTAKGRVKSKTTEPKPGSAGKSGRTTVLAGRPQTARPTGGRPQARPETRAIDQDDAGPVKVEVYVMSLCPFAAPALHQLIPAIKNIGERVDFQVAYIATQRAGRFHSLHGPAEVQADKIQLCAREIAPDRFLDFLYCQTEDYRTVLKRWRQCANRTGIDAMSVEACANGPEGKKLLAESAAKSRARRVPGSPTIYFANRRYSGFRSQSAFARAICRAMQGSRPAACANIPKPVEVHITLLNDKRCKERVCMRASGILRSVQRLFPGAKIETLDYSSPEGKKLYVEAKLRYLPAILFDANVAKAAGYVRIKSWLMPAENHQRLIIGAKFDPTAEICDNGKDDTGNGKVDCADESCKDKMVCRKEEPKRLDLFVMSHCPFGIKALNAMKEVLANFKGDITFHIHYIGDKSPDGSLRSMHGPKEVEEDKRELCAIKYYSRHHRYMNYIWCRNKNIRSDAWKRCATKGIRADRIARCARGKEGRRLLERSFELSHKLGIGASPTWLVNNRFKFSGLAAETVRRNLCRHNPKLRNCDKTLSSAVPGLPPSCK